MRKIREIVRLHAAGVSQREIGRVTEVSASTVGDLLGRVVVAGLSWPLSEDIDDEQLEQYTDAESYNYDNSGCGF